MDFQKDKSMLYKAGGPRLIVGHGCPQASYSIEERTDGDHIVERQAKKMATVNLAERPGLFVRFAKLPQTEGAYLAFVSQYGLFGLSDNYNSDTNQEESIHSINLFHRSFKEAYLAAETYINRMAAIKEASKTNDKKHRRLKKSETFELGSGQPLKGWIDRNIQAHTYTKLWDLNGGTALVAGSLAGSLVLQLYFYALIRKALHKCALPTCDEETTKAKFCSSNHQKLFNYWLAEDKMVKDEDGNWQRKPRKKPGRPRKKQEEQRP